MTDTHRRSLLWLMPLGVGALTLLVFLPAVRYDFARAWDDGPYLLFNSHLMRWDWRWMFSSIAFGHWIPLSWLSWTVDAHLWGDWAAPWHAENVLLHAIGAALVALISFRLTGSRMAAVTTGLLFGVHPMRIESVVWISERKDVLSGVFFFLAILTYLRYVATDARRRWTWYSLSLLCFVAAAMSKCIVVVLPVFLLLMDWALLNRRAWIEKAPYVLIAGIVSEFAFWTMHIGIHNGLPWDLVGIGPRLLHVGYSQIYYVWRSIWPSRFSHMIEYTYIPSVGQPEYPIAVALVLLAVLGLWLLRRREVTAAAIAYAVAVLPQSGLFQNGNQLVANRYSYLACLPLALLAGAGFAAASRRWPRLASVSVAAVVLALIVVTQLSMPIWRDSETLWTYSANAEPTCTVCQDWAGVFAYRRGDLAATEQYFRRAIPVSLDTQFPRYERYWGLGKVLEEQGKTQEAAAIFRVYLASVPEAYRGYPHEQYHLRDAEARLARLESR